MNIEKMPVLSVKYKIPSPRNHYIIRKGLLERLNQMKQMAVTIVKAGAGSGKTYPSFCVYQGTESCTCKVDHNGSKHESDVSVLEIHY